MTFFMPMPILSLRTHESIILLLLLEITCKLTAQDSIPTIKNANQDTSTCESGNYHLEVKRLVIPAVFVGYGVASLSVQGLRQLNVSTRDEVLEDSPARSQLDNFTQFLPALMVYGFNAAGIKGQHDYGGLTIIYATSMLLSTSITFPLKYLVGERRPDNSDRLSFPSGHTATAFASAQFMFREYRDSDLWLSLCGYPLAIFTGVYRVINNKHWVGDVVAGAGFGILSTELAYWLYPKINALFGGGKKSQTMIVPSCQPGNYAVALTRNF